MVNNPLQAKIAGRGCGGTVFLINKKKKKGRKKTEHPNPQRLLARTEGEVIVTESDIPYELSARLRYLKIIT